MFYLCGIVYIPNRVYQVPYLIRSQFPRPCTEVVTISAGRIASVTMCPLYGSQNVVPRLPTQNVSSCGWSRFVADVRRNQILQTIDVAGCFRSNVSRLFNVPPIGTIECHVTRGYRVLIPVNSSWQDFVEFAIRPRSVFSFRFSATCSSPTPMAVCQVTLFIASAGSRIVWYQVFQAPWRQAFCNRLV